MLHGMFGVGAFISPFVIQIMLNSLTWRQGYLAISGINAVIALVFIFLTWKDRKYSTESTVESKIRLSEVWDYLKDRYNLMLIISGVMYAAAQMGMGVWIVRYMTVQYNRADLGAAALSILWFTSTISRFCAIKLKFRPLVMFAFGSASIVVCQSLGLLINNPYIFLASYALIGLFSGLCIPVILAEALENYTGRTSLPTSVMFIAMSVFRIATPLIMGWISAVSSISVSMTLPVVISVVGIIAAYAALKIKYIRLN